MLDVARELKAQYPAITGCRVDVRDGEAHIEVLLPQHQVIVNAADADPQRALAAALARMRSHLDAIARLPRTAR